MRSRSVTSYLVMLHGLKRPVSAASSTCLSSTSPATSSASSMIPSMRWKTVHRSFAAENVAANVAVVRKFYRSQKRQSKQSRNCLRPHRSQFLIVGTGLRKRLDSVSRLAP